MVYEGLKESEFEKALCRLCKANAQADVLLTKREMGYGVSKREVDRVMKCMDDAKGSYEILRRRYVTDEKDGEAFEFFEDNCFQDFRFEGNRIYGNIWNIERIATPYYESPQTLYQHELGVLLLFHFYQMEDFYIWRQKKERFNRTILGRIIKKFKSLKRRRRLSGIAD